MEVLEIPIENAVLPSSFSSYKRYTTTFIAAINWQIDHVGLFEHIAIFPLASDPLAGGIKRSKVKLNIPNGSILQVKYKDAFKKVHVRGYGEKDISSQICFSNSTSVVMHIDKLIVLKIPSKGKIQITGCRTENQVYQAVHAIWKAIQQIKVHHPDVAKIPDGEVPRAVFHSVMNNINMDLGFRINKRKVHEFLYQKTEFHIIPNDKKYAGVTAKLEVEGIEKLPLVKHRFLNGKWYASTTTWDDYLSTLSPKDRKKEETSIKYQTFLIFYSGKVIQSGPRYELMEDVFVYFVNLMNKHRKQIEDLTVEMVTRKKKF